MKIQSYEILSTLGAGGMGTVYKVRHILTNEIRAIKSLNKSLCYDPEIRQRFINEAIIMSKLEHPNIVKVYDFIEGPEAMHIVMEYVEGETLNKIIGEKIGPIPYQKALPLFNQIADGIAYAHSKEVIHRDIKPSNIMLTPQNIIKITDFGIAKANDIGGATKTGTKMGTLKYMSPEQVEGRHADKTADIYSLGMTFYEMLAGKLPFSQEDCKSDFAISKVIIEKEFPPPTKFYPHIPKNIVSAVMKSLSKQGMNRFHSAEEFKECINEEKKVIIETKLGDSGSKRTLLNVVMSPTVIVHKHVKMRLKIKKAIFISATIIFIGLFLGYFFIKSYINNKSIEFYNSGHIKYNLVDYRGAIEDYNKAIELNPDYLSAYYNRGCTKYYLGDYRGAIEDYNKVLELKPNYVSAYYKRAESKVQLGDKIGASEDLKKAQMSKY